MQLNEICVFSIDQYIDKLIEFHGNFAPGLLVGGFMVDAAKKEVAQYEIFDAVCETTSCLPDAIQLLTPCTIGNGWLKIIYTGRFALALYDKKSGNGVRVNIEASKLDQYPEIKKWFMGLIPKREQNKEMLINEIRTAGYDLFTIKPITVSPAYLGKRPSPPIELCKSCGEPYPQNGSKFCLACQGMDIYTGENQEHPINLPVSQTTHSEKQ